MSEHPENLVYTSSHEWVRLEADGLVTVGISDHAQEALGDVVFVELLEPGALLAQGDEAAVVESVKAAVELYAPLGGEVVEINEELVEQPETVNREPYDGGWFFTLEPDDPSELDQLMSAEEYAAFCEDNA